MAEGSQIPPSISPQRLQQLANRIETLELESGDAWDNLLEKQQICTEILAEQVVVNSKFSEYHDMWLERGAADDVTTFYSLHEIDESVNVLENSLSGFETKAQTTIHLIKEAIISFQGKLTRIREIKESLENPGNLSLDEILQFETFLSADFTWLNATEIPNVTELKEEWETANLYLSMSECVDRMTHLVPPQEPHPPVVTENLNSDNSSSPELQT